MKGNNNGNNTNNNVPVPGWNAHRFPQAPLRPPNYLMQDVPKCQKDLKGSVLQEITERDQFKEAMAEMVLLCNEANRRTTGSTKKSSSKPLSLEYIADRLDVDDPCFGYLVRSEETGMLQGFITVTTFTNWQSSFRWDSLHELAFHYDDSDEEDDDDDNNNDKRAAAQKQRPRRSRRPKRHLQVDVDGRLACALQNTVRRGDPYNEGIVWPRIAEITLLGALGCGRALVSLVVEKLEFLKATANVNYDYVTLQATDNSIPFYESIGFVRVGAVAEEPKPQKQQLLEASSSSDADSATTTARSESPESIGNRNEDAAAAAASSSPPLEIVSSPLIVYQVHKPGETPTEIAKKCNVNVWDICFLNKDVYADILPRSRLIKGTTLHIPDVSKQTPEHTPTPPAEQEQSPPPAATAVQWFLAQENDTPRKIAKQFGVACRALVEANRGRLPELQTASRLKEGTRIKVSHLDQQDDLDTSVPYCHWSFPDDTVESGEPSYMMVYPLQRKGSRQARTVEQSLAVSISPYAPAPLLLPAPLVGVADSDSCFLGATTDPPKRPDHAPTAFDIFKNQQHDIAPPEEFQQLRPAQVEKLLIQRWKDLSDSKQARYEAIAEQTNNHYKKEWEEYEVEYSLWQEECTTNKVPANSAAASKQQKNNFLFNKVVKLRPDALLKSNEYTYWYVCGRVVQS
jgi:hypothetical protein